MSSFSKEGLKKFNNQEFFLKKIFQDSELFIEFLESNRNINSIILLSKVSLTNEFKEEANFLLDEICESYRTIEENFLEFHNTLDFTNKSDEFIQVFVRYTYLNSLSKNPDFKLVENDFYYELFTHIAKSGDLNKKKIKSFLNNRNTLDPKFNDVLLSLSNTYMYSQIPQTTRTKIFFKDMYFHFLKSNQLTFWSDRSSISKNEINNFIKLLVKNNDEKYLRSLFQEDLIISNQLINELIEDDLELFFENYCKEANKYSINETWISHLDLKEINAQPTVFSNTLLTFAKEPPKDFNFDTYIYWLALKNNFKVKRDFYNFPPREYGESKWDFGLSSKMKFSISLLKYFFKLKKTNKSYSR